MNGLPTMLRLRGVPVLVVGGGAVGTRRAGRMAAAGAVVRVVDPAAAGLPGVEGVEFVARGFEAGDVDGVRIVVVATADAAVNAAVAEAVAAMPEPRPWLNRADEADAGDLGFMASSAAGPLTVAVDSGGASAGEAKRLAAELAGKVDPERGVLLLAVARVRPLVRGLVEDPAQRKELLERMTSPEAMGRLQREGPAALEAWLGGLVGQARTPREVVVRVEADPGEPGEPGESGESP